MTIQRKLWISNLILMIITIVLLIGVSLIITKNSQEFIGFPPRDDHREPINRTFLRTDHIVNKTLETNPDLLLDQEYLPQLDNLLNSSNTGMIIQRHDKTLYYSPFLDSLNIHIEKILLEENQTDQDQVKIIRLSDLLTMKIVPLRFSDDSKAKLILINDATSVSEQFKQFKNSVIYTLILFLIIIIGINTLITYFLSKQIVNPLTQLKNAALQIRKGNYDFSLHRISKDEIGDLFQSFEEARKQLKNSEETKKKYEQNRNELITNISHDLKTPITTIKGYVEGIMDGVPKSKEKLDKYLKTIHQNVEHIESLIEDLFLLSKLDLDQSIYKFENIDIQAYLMDSYEELKFDLQEKGIQLDFEPRYNSKDLVKADRQQLKRVILNIIHNAMNYKNEINPTIKMILTEKQDEVEIEISDNGQGIPEASLNEIFDRFYKVDRARSNRSSGTGLGLYIAKKIILDHQGNIWARSKIGAGTSIFFTLKKLTTKDNQ